MATARASFFQQQKPGGSPKAKLPFPWCGRPFSPALGVEARGGRQSPRASGLGQRRRRSCLAFFDKSSSPKGRRGRSKPLGRGALRWAPAISQGGADGETTEELSKAASVRLHFGHPDPCGKAGDCPEIIRSVRSAAYDPADSADVSRVRFRAEGGLENAVDGPRRPSTKSDRRAPPAKGIRAPAGEEGRSWRPTCAGWTPHLQGQTKQPAERNPPVPVGGRGDRRGALPPQVNEAASQKRPSTPNSSTGKRHTMAAAGGWLRTAATAPGLYTCPCAVKARPRPSSAHHVCRRVMSLAPRVASPRPQATAGAPGKEHLVVLPKRLLPPVRAQVARTAIIFPCVR